MDRGGNELPELCTRLADGHQCLLPQTIGRQNPARQQRVIRYRVPPRLALRHWIADGIFQIAERAARPFLQHFQIPGTAAVDALEVPRARNDFRA